MDEVKLTYFVSDNVVCLGISLITRRLLPVLKPPPLRSRRVWHLELNRHVHNAQIITQKLS